MTDEPGTFQRGKEGVRVTPDPGGGEVAASRAFSGRLPREEGTTSDMIGVVKVLTLNMWGAFGPPERRPVLREAILKTEANLLLLQEANVPDNLLDSLPYPERFHFPEAGLAILSRFPAPEERRITYKVVSPLEPHLRGALFARLDVDGKNLWAGATHLAWKAEDGATRLAQVEELLSFTAALTDPVLIGGDFNAAPADPPIRRMISAGFKDLHSEGGITWDNQNPFIQSHSVRFPDRRIDYLFLRGQLPLVRCDVACRERGAGGLHPSDHYGVLALFQR